MHPALKEALHTAISELEASIDELRTWFKKNGTIPPPSFFAEAWARGDRPVLRSRDPIAAFREGYDGRRPL